MDNLLYLLAWEGGSIAAMFAAGKALSLVQQRYFPPKSYLRRCGTSESLLHEFQDIRFK